MYDVQFTELLQSTLGATRSIGVLANAPFFSLPLVLGRAKLKQRATPLTIGLTKQHSTHRPAVTVGRTKLHFTHL